LQNITRLCSSNYSIGSATQLLAWDGVPADNNCRTAVGMLLVDLCRHPQAEVHLQAAALHKAQESSTALETHGNPTGNITFTAAAGSSETGKRSAGSQTGDGAKQQLISWANTADASSSFQSHYFVHAD
jgi:hypothetical protein